MSHRENEPRPMNLTLKKIICIIFLNQKIKTDPTDLKTLWGLNIHCKWESLECPNWIILQLHNKLILHNQCSTALINFMINISRFKVCNVHLVKGLQKREEQNSFCMRLLSSSYITLHIQIDTATHIQEITFPTNVIIAAYIMPFRFT